MGKTDYEDDLTENDEDLDDEEDYEDDDEDDYDEFVLEELDKEAVKDTGEIVIEGSKIRDFAALVSWAEENHASISIENSMLYGTHVKGTSIDIFLDDVSCMEALDCAGERFSGLLRFDDVGFGESVDFGSAVFEKPVRLEDCSFYGPVNFAGCRFEDEVSFRDSEFEKECTFDGATFQGNVNLASTTFGQMVSFKDAQFEKGANLHRVDFDAGVDKTGSNIDGPEEEDASDDEHEQGEPGVDNEAPQKDTASSAEQSATRKDTPKKEFNPWQELERVSKKSVSRRQVLRGAFRFLPKKEKE